MSNFGNLIGAFMESAMAPSAGNRIGSALEQLQRSGFGGGAPAGGMPGGPGGMLGGILDMVKGGLGGAAQHPGQAGGLGAVLGSLMGGGKGAVQGGMMAVLASVAMKALTAAGEQQTASGQGGGLADLLGGLMPGGGQAQGSGPWSGGDVPLGMRPPQTTAEEEALESTAQLVLKGMINAAKSDGQISPKEMQRIVGKLQESGADQGMQQWVMQEMQAPLNVQAFAAEIPNQEVAAQVYTASLLAVEVDTDAERQYLQQFAQASGLHPLVVGQIHQTLGVHA
ncbi:tellurite resistance TerB family protein [uncultured Thiohalocapsa sp.]|uniref:tellurite resistance TerB family protein n=1 Tax=uncultured Thiohalocapsa sp. TaxID=768990 RepID=UPI0025F50503|nr:tellurite resistance TerB family protein [uncultured Thiohalocapsa sp.]